MPRPLEITSAPRRSSRLAIPPSSFSPMEPLTPPAKTVLPVCPLLQKRSLLLAPPPQAPLPWLWQCHLCQRMYPLGTTRRCLEDGHYFC
ncbi:hypothetical protein BDY21DRAFT_269818, partial [Lineolata rhizophorae]